MRAVLYGRVSSERQAGGVSKSVDDQLSSLRKWAANEGHEVVAEHRDDGISASRYARSTAVREDWRKVMDLVLGGLVEILAVWSIARATRDRAVWAALIAACQTNGVLLAVDGKIHDPSDPDDSFMLDIQAALAFNGSARISKDAKRSVDSRASRGAPHGRLQDGYAIEYDQTTGKPLRRVIDPVRGPIIREIVTRLLAGETAYAIATDFNRRGIPTMTGKEWHHTGVSKRVKSPTLAGLRVHHGEVLEGVTAEWEPLITMEEYHQLQALLSEPKRKTYYGGNTIKHLGTGIYECGVCGSPMRVISKKRVDGTRRVAYTCTGEHVCVTRAQEPVDVMVETAVVEFLSRPDVYRELVDGADISTTDVQNARVELLEINKELKAALALAESGDLSVTSFALIEKGLLARKEAAEQKARPKHLPTVIFDVAGPQAQQRWMATGVQAKRTIINALFTVKIEKQEGRGNRFDPKAVKITRRA